MATRKKNTEQADGQENQAMEKNMENAEAVSESETPETSSEIGQGNFQASETAGKPSEPEASMNNETATNETATKPAASDASRAESSSGVATSNSNDDPDDSPALEKLNVLADRFRVPSWQQAALLRYTGWMDDKLVPEDEYRRELENLKNRRIGGGRR